MSDSTGKKVQSRDDSDKENKSNMGRQDIPGSGILTNTPGSPRVPTPEEMAASPEADGMDNRINLNQSKSQTKPEPTSKKTESK